jgi:hypothetical protein
MNSTNNRIAPFKKGDLVRSTVTPQICSRIGSGGCVNLHHRVPGPLRVNYFGGTGPSNVISLSSFTSASCSSSVQQKVPSMARFSQCGLRHWLSGMCARISGESCRAIRSRNSACHLSMDDNSSRSPILSVLVMKSSRPSMSFFFVSGFMLLVSGVHGDSLSRSEVGYV